MAEPVEKEEVAPVEQTSAPQADLLNPPPSRFEKPAGVNTTKWDIATKTPQNANKL